LATAVIGPVFVASVAGTRTAADRQARNPRFPGDTSTAGDPRPHLFMVCSRTATEPEPNGTTSGDLCPACLPSRPGDSGPRIGSSVRPDRTTRSGRVEVGHATSGKRKRFPLEGPPRLARGDAWRAAVNSGRPGLPPAYHAFAVGPERVRTETSGRAAARHRPAGASAARRAVRSPGRLR